MLDACVVVGTEPRTYISGLGCLPMLLLVWSLARSRWREARVKLAVTMFLIVCVASLAPGPARSRRSRSADAVEAVHAGLPAAAHGGAGTFVSPAFLCLGVILALWLSDDSRGLPLRLTVATIVIGFTLPNPLARFWTTAWDDTPEFFASGKYRDDVAPGANLLILPYGIDGNSDLWQSRDKMYYRMAGGYVGPSPAIPAQYQPWPIVSCALQPRRNPRVASTGKRFPGAKTGHGSDCRGRWIALMGADL